MESYLFIVRFDSVSRATGVRTGTSEERMKKMQEYDELTPEEIAANLKEVQKNIEDACRRVGRDPSCVQICAVSKLKSAADMRAAMEAGQRLFGENYVQEICAKYEELKDECTIHMIGHLQRNKVKYLTDKVQLIHSVDSLELARQIEKEMGKVSRVMDVLLEVNVANEESKWGLAESEVMEAAKEIGALAHVRVRGLMTSAPYTEDPESNRGYFRRLHDLFEEMKKSGLEGVLADTLSMGMTGDYVVAVEEGSTMVRVGTGIFGRRNYNR